MNFMIHQSIHIHMLKVGSINNSSVLQIGTTGSIQGYSDIQNTGGFTEIAEEVQPLQFEQVPIIPLAPPIN